MDARSIIEAEIDQCRKAIEEAKLIALTLAKFDGKKVTKRLPVTVEYNNIVGEHGNYYLGQVVDVREIAAAKHYNATLEKLLAIDIEKAEQLFGGIEHHFNAILALFCDIEDAKLEYHNNPVYYKLLRAIHEGGRISLSDFYFKRKRQ